MTLGNLVRIGTLEFLLASITVRLSQQASAPDSREIAGSPSFCRTIRSRSRAVGLPSRTTRISPAHTPIRTTQYPKSIVLPSGVSATFTHGASV